MTAFQRRLLLELKRRRDTGEGWPTLQELADTLDAAVQNTTRTVNLLAEQGLTKLEPRHSPPKMVAIVTNAGALAVE